LKRILLITLAFLTLGILHAQTTQPPVIHVTLLGTGIPLLNVGAYAPGTTFRSNAGTLVEAGGERFLFDCGQGVLTRLLQSGGADPINNPNVAVDKVFISHMHSDHMSDLPALYSYAWLFRYNVPLQVWGPGPGPNGPFGISAVMPLLRLVWDSDVNARSVFKQDVLNFPPSGMAPVANELKDGVVYSNNGVTVTAFLVDHHPVAPAYGFRVDYKGKSVVYSGDTTYNSNLVSHSAGTDVLLHEIYGFPREAFPEFYDYHTSPEDFARVVAGTGAKLPVFTHIATGPGTVDDLVNRTRAAGYTGPLQVGADLMTIDIFADKTVVNAAPKTGDTELKLSLPDGGMLPARRRTVIP
jgi:ribonuclease Z